MSENVQNVEIICSRNRPRDLICGKSAMDVLWSFFVSVISVANVSSHKMIADSRVRGGGISKAWFGDTTFLTCDSCITTRWSGNSSAIRPAKVTNSGSANV